MRVIGRGGETPIGLCTGEIGSGTVVSEEVQQMLCWWLEVN